MAKRRQTKRTALVKRATENLEGLPQGGQLDVMRRLASDPKLTVEKLGELVKLQERILDREAMTAFDTAYRIMQPKIPRIKKNGAIKNKQGDVQSRYSKYEDIRKVCDPILLEHGFTLHTWTEWPAPGVAEVVGELVHDHGGRRRSRFQSGADGSGGKNAIQGLGSAVSYGKRYVYKDLLQIVEEGEDDDGQGARTRTVTRSSDRPASPAQRPPAPETIDVSPSLPVTGEPITDRQLARFHALVSNSGRSAEDVKAYLLRRFGWTSSRQITRERYDAVCTAIEGRGDLS